MPTKIELNRVERTRAPTAGMKPIIHQTSTADLRAENRIVSVATRETIDAVGSGEKRHQLLQSAIPVSPRTNLDVTADDSFLDPHVSCVKASHPAPQLNVNPEQRSVRQSTISGPYREVVLMMYPRCCGRACGRMRRLR
jgi:hypothetical protein